MTTNQKRLARRALITGRPPRWRVVGYPSYGTVLWKCQHCGSCTTTQLTWNNRAYVPGRCVVCDRV